jgi:hypothetical protein
MKQIAKRICLSLNHKHAGRAALLFALRTVAIDAEDWGLARRTYRAYERQCNLACKWADRSRKCDASS